jgi:hypothetical protein
MKKASTKKPEEDDLRDEHGAEFFRNAKPNRFAQRVKVGRTRPARAAAKTVKKRGSYARILHSPVHLLRAIVKIRIELSLFFLAAL